MQTTTTVHKANLTSDDKKRGDECYDRLTNPKNFHGMYKERFKEKGLIEGEPAAVSTLCTCFRAHAHTAEWAIYTSVIGESSV